MDLSILIPAKNCSVLTAACLDAVRQTVPAGLRAEVLVFDDLSTDETPAMLAGRASEVACIRADEPGWFARNMNTLARAARGRWHIHLNNDTIPLPGWIEPLLRAADEHPEAAVIGNLHLYPAPAGRVRHINHAGVVFDEAGTGRHLYQGLPEDLGPARASRGLQAVSAACWLTQADVFRDLGGYDEGYVNGHEDLDFCMRARSSGMTVRYEGQSAIIHLGSSTPGRLAHNHENHRRFLDNWAGMIEPDQEPIAEADGIPWPQFPASYRIARTLSRQPVVRQAISAAVRTPVGAKLRQEFVTRFSTH